MESILKKEDKTKQDKDSGIMNNRKKLGIYVHIPFCVRKCLYCDFLSAKYSDEIVNSYVNKLLEEIDLRADEYSSDYEVDSVFFGGGTPSFLSADNLCKILCKLKGTFSFTENCEITTEVNPGTVDFTKLYAYKKAGFNRLSIGLQSADDSELMMLGRIHKFADFEETYENARKAGFDNINVDVMSAIPGQTEESLARTLSILCGMKPEHLSVYSLIVEEGTPFASMNLDLPDEDTEREMYALTGEILRTNGYEMYEISNYAKPGFECRHNIKYWERDEYLGLGLGASSLLGGEIPDIRLKDTTSMDDYLNSEFLGEKEILSREDCMAEFMFLGLRMNRGVSLSRFEDVFGCSALKVYGEAIDKHIKEGLLEYSGRLVNEKESERDERIRLTNEGRNLANYVMCDFLPD